MRRTGSRGGAENAENAEEAHRNDSFSHAALQCLCGTLPTLKRFLSHIRTNLGYPQIPSSGSDRGASRMQIPFINAAKSGFLFRRRIVLAALAVGVLALVWSYRNLRSADRLEQLATRARARGVPASRMDLERQYPFQPAVYSNFLAFNTLFAGLPYPPPSASAATKGVTNRWRPVSKEMLAWMETYTATATQLQQRLLEGVSLDFGIRLGPAIVEFPHNFSDHQAAVTLLRMQAEWAFEKGRMDAGVAAMIAAARMIRYNGGDYSTTGAIIRQNEIKSTYDSVQNLWVPGPGRFSDTQLRDLQQAFAQLLEAPTLNSVFRINWAAHMDFFRSDDNWMQDLLFKGAPPDGFLSLLLRCAYELSGSKSADVYDHLRISDARCEAFLGSMTQRQQRLQALDAEVAVILKKWNRPLFQSLTGNIPILNRRELWCIAWIRTVVTTFAVERFRLKYDRLPVDTAALVPEFLPEVPLDPIDEKPLRYHREGSGYVVYSIGANGRDDDGQLGPAENENAASATVEGDQGIRVQ